MPGWRIFYIWLFLSGYVIAAPGQNLISNPGFEDILVCPDQSGQLTNAVSWLNPNLKSPDLYHRCVGPDCANLPFVCVPDNWVGFQSPFSGQAYAGLFVGGGNPNREYMQVSLNSPLDSGQAYALSYYLSLADDHEHAIDQMGAYFSNEVITIQEPHALVPQSSSPAGLFLSDKSNWMEVRDTFLAAGGEAFLTIGNFNDEDNTQFITGLGGGKASAYYYFDAFSLTAVPKEAVVKEGNEQAEAEEASGEDEDAQMSDNTSSPCNFFIPDAFSPNGDGINDFFSTPGDCTPESYELLIFNRWGTRVFSSSSPEVAWDGFIRGQRAPQGIYAYLLRYRLSQGEVLRKGKIVLIR